jgi:triosephosphate isomerase (TIM)
MKKKLIIANWKMNPSTSREALLLAYRAERGAARIKNIEVVLAPPFPFLIPVMRIIKKAKLGAQDAAWRSKGPFTGQVSWQQLRHLGVKYVIVGHSERREQLGETDDMVNKKVLELLSHGMGTVLCIGEREREGDDIPAVVGVQLKKALRGVKRRHLNHLYIAYEPIWAISTTLGSRSDTPDNAFQAVVYIRKIITNLFGRKSAEAVRVLYGGSVRASNVASFLTEGKTDGALVGGASLDPIEFSKVIEEASRK